MFELDGVPATLAEEAIRRGAAKLPVRTRFVVRPGEEASR
jgi:large subunit ribosomal protein L16